MQRISRLFVPLFIILGIVIMGICGFMIIEGYNLLDALYMTIITITSIGYGETHPLSASGRVFNLFLILSSFATFAFALAKLTQYIVEGEINKYFKSRRVMSAINHLKDHVIICGFGRNGQQAAATLQASDIPFVVIESNEAILENVLKKDPKLLYLKGNATDDDLLHHANIKHAKALLSTLPVDADNVFIVLSARSINNKLIIISRASANSSHDKLIKAGANNVIMPDKIGGAHMAGLVSKPEVIEFVDFLGGHNQLSPKLCMVDVKIASTKTMHDITTNHSVNIIGVKHLAGHYEINPPSTEVIQAGMKLFLLADAKAVRTLQQQLS